MKKILYPFVISILFLACEKSTQEPPTPEPDNEIEDEPANQTILDSITTLSLTFDSEGTAWIGTLSQGLVKHNSNETIIFNSSNSPLTTSPIWDIATDHQNNIWLSQNGLIKYDGNKFTKYDTGNSGIPEDIVWSIAIDSKDNVWVASNRFNEGGMAMFNGESFEVYLPENSPLPVNEVKSIAIDENDNIWLSATHSVTNTYLIHISDGKWTIYDSADFGQELYWIGHIALNSKKEVCGIINNGYASGSDKRPRVFRFDGENMKVNYMDEKAFNVNFESLLIDHNDHYWCTFSYGYAHYDGSEWHKTQSEIIESDQQSYYKDAYFTVEQAPDGNIWLGKDNGIEIIELE